MPTYQNEKSFFSIKSELSFNRTFNDHGKQAFSFLIRIEIMEIILN